MEKSFLFDVVSRVYLATDLNPVDMSSYELCCDMIDVVIDVSCIYGVEHVSRREGHAPSACLRWRSVNFGCRKSDSSA